MAPFVRAGGLVRARYWPSESVVSNQVTAFTLVEGGGVDTMNFKQ